CATVPDVYISSAVAPTIRPIARITPARTPGMADGSTMRNTVRSFPAPSPKLPSRYESGTAFNASSVVLMIRSEEHTSELQSRFDLVCRLLLEKKNKKRPAQRVITVKRWTER